VTTARKFRVLLVPDSIYWVTGTIAKAIATANPWIDATVVSGPLLGELFPDETEIAERFDLVHFICPYSSRDWMPRLRAKVPVVTSHHHVTSWDLIAHNIDGDAIVAGSSEWVHDLEKRGANMSRVFRVPYGVDVNLFTPPTLGDKKAEREKLGLAAANPVIGFFAKRASNDDDRKGTDVFVEAVFRLHQVLPSAGVLIVGPGWQELVAKFKSAGIACAWIPFVVDSRDIAPLYHALDFYWVTARVEGGPVPLLEAMSGEVCCLSTEVGLAREVVKHAVNAELLPMNDSEIFASRTAELWKDEDRRAAMGRAARETMLSEMRDHDMAQLVKGVYERAVEVFSERNPGVTTARVPEKLDGITAADGDVPLMALSDDEKRRARMLEALAWSENLVLYQDQRGAALKLIVNAWRDNPLSLEPPRVMLRRFLPEPVTKGIVSLKRKLGGAA
jgi:glycosyltransferase involved in cell wall biosynthesis